MKYTSLVLAAFDLAISYLPSSSLFLFVSANNQHNSKQGASHAKD
jgi:hypothetical protein